MISSDNAGGAMRYIHRPVMLKEVIHYLQPNRVGLYIDATCGEGGHSEAILDSLHQEAFLLCVDRDPEILEVARQRLGSDPRVFFLHASYADINAFLEERGERAMGLLVDLGVSSYHLEHPERGFSFSSPVLDMRFDRSDGVDCLSFLQRLSQRRLEEILREFGEERKARFLASRIYQALRQQRITSAADLSSLVEKVLPRRGRLHPATRLFQALRIAVNRELQHLETLLRLLPSLLAAGGRFVAISYHSLEDRLIKQWIRRYAAERVLKILTKKVVRASAEEVAVNRRARSAKLRAAEALV